jgi:low temperature requirement protein LtrA
MSAEQAAPADETAEQATAEEEHRVTTLELFFDLVFVFAVTQVTGLMAGDPTWAGLGRGLLVLAALWWAWGAYAWLTNEIDPEEGSALLALLGAMAAMFVSALAVPGAFTSDGVLFGIAYFALRAMHIVLFAAVTPNVDVRQAAFRLARTAIPGPALLVVAGFLDGPAQIALWIAALTIDYSGPYVFGVRGFSVHAEHFAERYGLVVIIALGESIVAIGIGAAGIELDLSAVVAAVLGLGLTAALWWAYFDVVARVARRKLLEAQGLARVRLARDAFSYLHLPLFVGIVLSALGMKTALAHLHEPLDAVIAVALCGGVAIYLLSLDAIRFRDARSVNRRRIAAALVSAGLIPLAVEVDALAALAAVAAVPATFVAYEAIRFRERRAELRAAA